MASRNYMFVLTTPAFIAVYMITLTHGKTGENTLMPGALNCRKYNPFLTKQEASSFVYSKRYKRAIDCSERHNEPPDCHNEHSCECYRVPCTNEYIREEQCVNKVCGTGNVCYLQVACPVHYITACAVDHCLSNPCQSRGTCINGMDTYGCQCETRWNGVNCENDTCDPVNQVGADIVFVVDSSKSQGQVMFKKQKQYIKKFIGNFSIGPTKTQVAIVSFAYNATIHCYLNTHTSEASLLSEIYQMTFMSGASYTGHALKVTREDVLTATQGMRVGVNHYVIVMTDGMSSDATDTLSQANSLTTDGHEVLAVAFGAQIYHSELRNIPTEKNKIFNPSNTDGLFAIFKQQTPECPDCYRNTSDVIVLFDASTDLKPAQFYPAIDALRVLVKGMPIGPNNVHVSYIKYAKDVQEQFDFTENRTNDEIITLITSNLEQFIGPVNVSKALDYVTKTGFDQAKGARTSARKFVILFTLGNFNDFAEVKSTAEILKASGVTLATVGVGENVNMTSLLEIASDPFYAFATSNVFHISDEILLAMTGSLEFDVCDIL